MTSRVSGPTRLVCGPEIGEGARLVGTGGRGPRFPAPIGPLQGRRVEWAADGGLAATGGLPRL
jgi:hypothetical protein